MRDKVSGHCECMHVFEYDTRMRGKLINLKFSQTISCADSGIERHGNFYYVLALAWKNNVASNLFIKLTSVIYIISIS